MKYKRATIQIAPRAYVHSVKANIPAWSDAAIARFVSRGRWIAVYDRTVAYPAPAIPPEPIVFRTADNVEQYDGSDRLVIVRRLERRKGVRLVEIDGVPWKLQTCASNKAFACLVPAGTLEFSEVQ